jgi:hypothetical protein
MRNGSCNTSKCRGKLQKIFLKILKFQQYNNVQVSTRNRWATAGCRPATGRYLDRANLPLFFLKFSFSCPPLFVQVVNSCWLATTHARPGQTLPKNFKHS